MIRNVGIVVGLAILAALLGSCAGTTYIVDQDTLHDFGGYETYAWFKLAAPPDKAQPPTEANTILTRRVKRAIDAELAGRGMGKTSVDEADFLITYSIVLQPRIVVYHTGWSMPYASWGWGWPGWGWGAGWTGGRSTVDQYTEGTIVVDVLDRDNRSLVWRGIAEGAFSRPNPDDARIATVITKVLRDFPPA
jgi:hypothetical protein